MSDVSNIQNNTQINLVTMNVAKDHVFPDELYNGVL